MVKYRRAGSGVKGGVAGHEVVMPLVAPRKAGIHTPERAGVRDDCARIKRRVYQGCLITSPVGCPLRPESDRAAARARSDAMGHLRTRALQKSTSTQLAGAAIMRCRAKASYSLSPLVDRTPRIASELLATNRNHRSICRQSGPNQRHLGWHEARLGHPQRLKSLDVEATRARKGDEKRVAREATVGSRGSDGDPEAYFLH